MTQRDQEHFDWVFEARELKWHVRAFLFDTAEEAAAEWQRIEAESVGKEKNFSVWRTMNPERTEHFVVLCGPRERLPAVRGGETTLLDAGAAKMFAIRRMKVGHDAYVESGGKPGHVDQEMRYGEDSPVTIDRETGDVKPYRWR